MNLTELRKLLGDVERESVFHPAAKKIIELSRLDGCRMEIDPAVPASELADIYRRRAHREARMNAEVFGLCETALVLQRLAGWVVPVAIEAEQGNGLVFLRRETGDVILACIFISDRGLKSV